MPDRDLTNGSIGRGVLSLAVPMIASSVLHSIQNLVDMFFVGRLGPSALAAVGMSGAVLMVLVTLFIGINVATGAMVARAVGAGDRARAGRVAGQSMLLTAVFSCAVGAVGYWGAPVVLRGLGARGDVIALGTGYLHIVFAGTFFMCVAFVISGVMHGAGDAVTPLFLGILTTACNVILNPLLIFGYLGFPAMGVPGSALATVIARSIAFVVGIAVLARARSRVRLRLGDLRPEWRTMWRIMAVAVPSSLQMSVRALMGLALMTIVAKFGTLVVAAYTVGLRIRMIGLFPSFGFGGSAATMVGQNLGASRPDRSQRSAWVAARMALLVSGVVAVMFLVFAPQLIAVFNDDPAVVATGAHLLRVTALGLMGAAVGIVLSRAISGAGDTVSPLVVTLVVLWGFQIPTAVYLSGVKELWGFRVPLTGLFRPIAVHCESGIWYAMLASSILQAAVMAIWFSTGRWKHKKL